jgi:hypothetical protein
MFTRRLGVELWETKKYTLHVTDSLSNKELSYQPKNATYNSVIMQSDASTDKQDDGVILYVKYIK